MDSPQDSRHKRLKVGRACYTCRAKKIKCDGLRPCMQCKARNRPCTFYKDGSFDPDQEMPEDTVHSLQQQQQQQQHQHQQHQHQHQHQHSHQQHPHSSDSTSSSTNAGTDQYTINNLENATESCYLFADTKDGYTARSKRRGPPLESRTSNTLASLGEGLRKVSLYDRHSGKTFTDAEPYGSFLKWVPEPPLPSRYTGSIEMPSRELQMEMLEQFFRENYEVMPIVPRRYFFEQLRCKGPFITPLLLNAIYAQTSRYLDNSELPKPEVFYHRAKRLLDDFMDMPRISTVVALCYMSLYEPSPSTHRSGSPFCRSWMYSGMAYRMCLELGLHNQSNISKELPREEIELRKRVFWSCYCLDKVQSGGWERPWMITKQFALVDLPNGLPDDDAEEQLILENLKQKIKFAQMCEDALMYANEHLMTSGGTGSNGEKEKIETFQNHFSDFVRNLPRELQWTPTSTLSVDDVLRLPAPRPMVIHLHLVFNQCILDQLFRAPNNAYNQFQRRIMATCITQLVHFMCERPASIMKYDLIVHSLLSAIKVHVRHLYHSDVGIARQSWAMFDRSILSIHKLRRYATIPNSAKFLQQLGSSTDGYEIPEEVMATVSAATAAAAVPTTINATTTTTQPPVEQQQQQQHFDSRQAAGSFLMPSPSTPTPIIPLAPNDMTSSDDVLSRMYLGQQQQQQQRTHPPYPSVTSPMSGPPPPRQEDNEDYVVMSMNQQQQQQQQQQHHNHNHNHNHSHQPHQQQQDWGAPAPTPILQSSSSSSPSSQATLHASIIMDPVTVQGGLMSPSLATARKNNADQFIQLHNPNDLLLGKYAAAAAAAAVSQSHPQPQPQPPTTSASNILYNAMPPPPPHPTSSSSEHNHNHQQRTLWHFQD